MNAVELENRLQAIEQRLDALQSELKIHAQANGNGDNPSPPIAPAPNPQESAKPSEEQPIIMEGCEIDFVPHPIPLKSYPVQIVVTKVDRAYPGLALSKEDWESLGLEDENA